MIESVAILEKCKRRRCTGFAILFAQASQRCNEVRVQTMLQKSSLGDRERRGGEIRAVRWFVDMYLEVEGIDRVARFLIPRYRWSIKVAGQRHGES